MKILSYLVFLLLMISCFSVRAGEKKAVEDIIPVTMGNLRGHKSLYNEGWYVITSSKKALSYAYDQSIKSSGDQLSEMTSHQGNRISNLSKSIKKNAKSSIKTGKSYYQEGKKSSQKMREETQDITRIEINTSKEFFVKAWERFTLGYIHLGERTKEDWEELQNLMDDFFSH